MKLQEKRWPKVAAWLMVVAGGLSCAACAAGAVMVEHYSDGLYSSQSAQLTQDYLACAKTICQDLMDPGETAQEQRVKEAEILSIQDSLENSGFYYEIRRDDTDQVVYTNLKEDSQRQYLVESTTSSDIEMAETYAWDEEAEETGEENLVTVYNQICYYDLGSCLEVDPSPAMGEEPALRSESCYVYVDGEFAQVMEIQSDEQGIALRYNPEILRYADQIRINQVVDTCYLLQSYGDMLPLANEQTNWQTIQEATDAGYVYVLVEDEYFQVLEWTEDRDSLVLTWQMDTDSYLSDLDAGLIFGEYWNTQGEIVSPELEPQETDDEDTEKEVSYTLYYGTGAVEGYETEYDKLQATADYYQGLKAYLPQLVVGMVVFGLVNLAGAVYLCIASGHRGGKEGITLNWFDRIPLDVLAAAGVLAGCLFVLVGDEIWNNLTWWLSSAVRAIGTLFNWATVLGLSCVAGYLLAAEVVALWLVLTFLARCKAGTVMKNFLVVRLLMWMGRPVVRCIRRAWRAAQENLSLVLKVAVAFGVYALVDLICLIGRYGTSGGFFLLWLVLHLALLAGAEYWCIHFRAIWNGVARLNQGETEAQIDTGKMPHDLKVMGEQLNHLSEGIRRAVEKQMQSERFRSELITNVSHDLKTPLTSIINYIDLLKQTEIQDSKAQEYLEVLDRKSQRLKKLTEDLVEASKAATGAMKVERTVLDFGQLVTQALGEYDAKLQAVPLYTVYQPPEQPLLVLADGRHLWRVLDNLLNNCMKYAMPRTRVYLSFRQEASQVTLEMKNISAEPLNLTEEELLERFVRGDASRTTEGSGLGLNIAMNLTELQGGQFRLSVDGDLFKVTVTIPSADKA